MVTHYYCLWYSSLLFLSTLPFPSLSLTAFLPLAYYFLILSKAQPLSTFLICLFLPWTVSFIHSLIHTWIHSDKRNTQTSSVCQVLARLIVDTVSLTGKVTPNLSPISWSWKMFHPIFMLMHITNIYWASNKSQRQSCILESTKMNEAFFTLKNLIGWGCWQTWKQIIVLTSKEYV